jgi:3-hydroxyisobutyrate dehydrogenase-like beta-hydroxyacid dehydrogenase
MTIPPVPGQCQSPVGVIGLGLMGTAITQRLLEHGLRPLVWNRTRERALPLLESGAAWSDCPLADCQRVIVSLFSSDVVSDVLTPWLDRITADTIIIDTTTGSPADSRRLAKQVAARGGRYLDAPISGSSEQTSRGEATVMAGGDREAFDACGDLWPQLARRWFYVGPSGSAAEMKLVSNLVLGLNRAAVAEGLLLAEACGLDLGTTLQILRESPACSRQMESKGPKMVAGDFTPQARLSQHLKDVRLMLDEACRRAVQLPLTERHRGLLEQAEQLGYGDQDNSAVFQALRDLNGQPEP